MRKVFLVKFPLRKDIFDRGLRLKKVNIDNKFPEYILRNKKNLSNWIL